MEGGAMLFLKKILQCLLCWRIRLPAWSDDAQAVCACTFGRTDDACNQVIAVHVAEHAAQHQLPYCVQAEIGAYLNRNLFGYSSVESLDTHRAGYVGTNETVHEQVTCYLQSQRITKIHVEAHPEHAWRVVMCYRRFGMEVVSVCTSGKPYPSQSTQRWCRSKLRFVPYEILARLLYLAKGYI